MAKKKRTARQVLAELRRTRPLPCPCCGGDDLRVGVHSNESSEVACQNRRCRLRTVRAWPLTPKGFFPETVERPTGDWEKTETLLYALAALEALKAWNRRPKPKEKR